MWFKKPPKHGGKHIRVLAIVGSEMSRQTLVRVADRRGWDLIAQNGIDSSASGQFEIALYDRGLGDWRHGVSALARLSPCVLLISRITGDSLWQELVECGGYEILLDPFGEEQALRTMERGLRYSAAIRK